MHLPPLYHHCASFGRPLVAIERSLWRPLCLHSVTTATPEPHYNGSAPTLPPLHDLLCQYSSFGGSRNAQGSCCSSYTETELSGFGRPLSVIFWSFKGGMKVAALCKGFTHYHLTLSRMGQNLISDLTWAPWCVRSPSTNSLFWLTPNITRKLCITDLCEGNWPLWRESTDDRLIPLSKGQ